MKRFVAKGLTPEVLVGGGGSRESERDKGVEAAFKKPKLGNRHSLESNCPRTADVFRKVARTPGLSDG